MTPEGQQVITPTTSAPASPAPAPSPSVSTDESITAWALAARGGDPEAVERFVGALHHDVQRFVAHLCADPQVVDDLAQDTFLRALGSLHRFEGRCSARTWLLSIARRAVIDSFRYAAVRPRAADVADWRLAVERAQPQGLPGFDDGVALVDLLGALPDERREAFVLTQVVGVSYEDAARLIGCPVGTVRSRVARARATLVELVVAAEGEGRRGCAAGFPRPRRPYPSHPQGRCPFDPVA
ncbi:sigma-70 family RNA polymerase sigma factor [Streptomyces ipomoeae]|uniref:RNA polymerase sigma factor n=1 Tax=Streptomyces ipomoeae TaxID=103232 RepID=A0A540PMT2_9ACTN|nr:sigma-70 family RNA polymerase sigma factor [Streptomyces ipomoeae]MDX2936433.1 sigma-70 family RNA polymerase sigma factor [Streptomyces ipomoeae]TQE16829.1 sigma-70 family RNA polymerase sigma factor [Streptomyces ipomoeae]TQE24518.1 sigma-70 family RNA polymerase sigma factor [Streptomyces ipomoeae]TQE36440.1 sigma-70 family RNA polymerase sigma factor [Streptomyces ipomoeae]